MIFATAPFSRHRIHLTSYLNGSRGHALLLAISQSGYTPDKIARIVATRGGLELSVPSAVDRMFWEGNGPLLVEGSALTVSERKGAERASGGAALPTSAVAYTADVTPRSTSVMAERQYPLIYISPSVLGFGADPEQRRAAAPRANRAAVSNFEEEISTYRERGDSSRRTHPDSAASASGPAPSFLVVCPPEDPTCGGGGGGSPPPRPMGVSIPSGLDYYGCYRPGYWTNLQDRDFDGILDECEGQLAIAFKPQLVFMANDCEVRRQPQFAVRQKVSPDWGGVILLFYAISYTFDCGPVGHRGDTEFIIEEVGPSINAPNGPWALKYATLSAHWHAPFNDNTAGYAATDLEDAEGSPGFGAPRIWVSKNKHANYRTQIVCGSAGTIWEDSCAWPVGCIIFMSCPHPTYSTLDFTTDRNLGSRYFQFIGAANSPVYDAIYYSGRYEHYWIWDETFCGWLALSDVSTCADSYDRPLILYDF